MIEFIISLLFVFLPPCEQEDSTLCHWNALTMGNGEGHSFISLTKNVCVSL